MEEDNEKSGFMLATRFDVMYKMYLKSGRYDTLADDSPVKEQEYGIPFRGYPEPPPNRPHYRGIDRRPLQALSYKTAEALKGSVTSAIANDATELMDRIEKRIGREDGWLTSVEDIIEVWKLLDKNVKDPMEGVSSIENIIEAWETVEKRQSAYEIIWAKEYTNAAAPPPYCVFLGCDAAYFISDHFSCICDALFIPRWHGTDQEGVLFRKHFDTLNANGLFNTNEEALDYLAYYLSFDWTERSDDFTSIEVYSVDMAGTGYL